jgi:hypothetical protein
VYRFPIWITMQQALHRFEIMLKLANISVYISWIKPGNRQPQQKHRAFLKKTILN